MTSNHPIVSKTGELFANSLINATIQLRDGLLLLTDYDIEFFDALTQGKSALVPGTTKLSSSIGALSSDSQRLYCHVPASTGNKHARLVCIVIALGRELMSRTLPVVNDHVWCLAMMSSTTTTTTATTMTTTTIASSSVSSDCALAAGMESGSIVFFDPTTLLEVHRIQSPSCVRNLAFANSSYSSSSSSSSFFSSDTDDCTTIHHYLVAACQNGSVCCFAVKNRSANNNNNNNDSNNNKHHALTTAEVWMRKKLLSYCFCCSIGGDKVVAGGSETLKNLRSDGKCVILNLADGVLLSEIKLGQAAVVSAHFLLSHYVLMSDEIKSLFLWDLESSRQVQQEVTGCGRWVSASADGAGSVIAASSFDARRVTLLKLL